MALDQPTLKRRSDLHIARKLWHMGGVSAMVATHYFLTTDQALQVLAVVAFLAVALDVIRQQSEGVNRWVLKLMGIFMREHERSGLAGTSYLLIGTFVILWWFPRPVVSLSLAFLAVADPLASYVGILYGKDKLIGAKSFQGTFAAFIACTVIAAIYCLATGLMVERVLIVSILAGLSGALAELLPIGKLDDNLTFPIVSAGLLWLIFTAFGGLT